MPETKAEQVFNVLRALQPDIIGFAWEMHGDGLDAAESYGNLSVICPTGELMETDEFTRYSLTREVMEALEDVLYHAGWASREFRAT